MASEDELYPNDSDYAEEEGLYKDEDIVGDEYVHDSVSANKPYKVLKESDILKRQELEISQVSGILSISQAAASKLLYHFRWNVSHLHDEWFSHEPKIREEVGLPTRGGGGGGGGEVSTVSATCEICFNIGKIYPMACWHNYCENCWRHYITESINDGPGCLQLRCPNLFCRVGVCRDMVDDLVSEGAKAKYARFFMRSYVELSKTIKWCPAPGCDSAVEFELGNNRDADVFDVVCLCSTIFCWNCGLDAHRPVRCDVAVKSANTAWILANTKSCPKCKRNIQKIGWYCKHMICAPPCNYEFCWVCLGDYYTNRDGGNRYNCKSCKIYKADKKAGLYDEEIKRRVTAKKWLKNSREKAIADLKEIQTVTLIELSNKTMESETQLGFIVDAWEQIIECRRVLKWTYRLTDDDDDDDDQGSHVQKEFFEYTLAEAEGYHERLHKCAEKELKVFLKDDNKSRVKPDFGEFRQKLVNLTVVTRSYFDKLVTFLESQR